MLGAILEQWPGGVSCIKLNGQPLQLRLPYKFGKFGFVDYIYVSLSEEIEGGRGEGGSRGGKGLGLVSNLCVPGGYQGKG
jgi:hypothetical protein